MENIEFVGEDGEKILFYPLESTRLAGRDYILVTDVPSGDGDCYILEDISKEQDEEANYVFVEDETLLDNLLNVFSELLDDVDLEG